MKYKVKLIREQHVLIEVEADDTGLAEMLVEDMYYDCDIDDEDFETDFYIAYATTLEKK